ncbi:MAG: helix-turn-helix transcriptional regulator [Verrucomicrobiota bacterium]
MTNATATVPLVGKVIRNRSMAAADIAETTYSPELTIPRHAHPFPYFCAVLSGAFEDVAGAHHRSCVRSTVFLRPAEEVHSDRFALAGARCLAVELKASLLERLDEPALVNQRQETKGGPAFDVACRLAAELTRWDQFSALAAEGFVLELLAGFSRSAVRSNGCPVWLRQAIEILQDPAAPGLTLSQIAGAVKVHPAHFARVFRAVHGCTVGEYVRQRRIQLACAELGQLDRPLSAIALDAGFADQSHFCRIFKRLMGESPASYRRRVYGSGR